MCPLARDCEPRPRDREPCARRLDPGAQLTFDACDVVSHGGGVAAPVEPGRRPIRERAMAGTTSQDLEFMKTVFQKLEGPAGPSAAAQQQQRLMQQQQAIASSRFHDGVHGVTARGGMRALNHGGSMSAPALGGGDRRDLLVQKKVLLTRLHQLVSMEERIVADGGSSACSGTGRSQALSGFGGGGYDSERRGLRSSCSRSTASTQASQATFLSRGPRPAPVVPKFVPPLRMPLKKG